MKIDSFNKATELYNKYRLCEKLIAFLSKESSKKMRCIEYFEFEDILVSFADTFKDEFMALVTECMNTSREAFEALDSHDCKDGQNDIYTQA